MSLNELRFPASVPGHFQERGDTVLVPTKKLREMQAEIAAQPAPTTKWQSIETAPRDNARLLYLARFDNGGDLVELDFDGIWEYWQESWEMAHINGYSWKSAEGIEEPTHWAYQDEPLPTVGANIAALKDSLAQAQHEVKVAQAVAAGNAKLIAALREDKGRLDWLDQQVTAYGTEGVQEGNQWLMDGPFASLRVAIDECRPATVQAAKQQGE